MDVVGWVYKMLLYLYIVLFSLYGPVMSPTAAFPILKTGDRAPKVKMITSNISAANCLILLKFNTWCRKSEFSGRSIQISMCNNLQTLLELHMRIRTSLIKLSPW